MIAATAAGYTVVAELSVYTLNAQERQGLDTMERQHWIRVWATITYGLAGSVGAEEGYDRFTMHEMPVRQAVDHYNAIGSPTIIVPADVAKATITGSWIGETQNDIILRLADMYRLRICLGTPDWRSVTLVHWKCPPPPLGPSKENSNGKGK